MIVTNFLEIDGFFFNIYQISNIEVFESEETENELTQITMNNGNAYVLNLGLETVKNLVEQRIYQLNKSNLNGFIATA